MRALMFTLILTLVGCYHEDVEYGARPADMSSALSNVTRLNSAAVAQNEYVISEITDSPAVLDLLAAPDRSPQDRALDGPRQTADLLTYLDISPGMRVAQLASGGGYFTELIARRLGPSGLLYAMNPPSLAARAGIAQAWSARMSKLLRSYTRVVRVDREFDAPLPAAARGLDLVYLDYFYGDLGQSIDRRELDASIFDALHPGGRFVVIDHTPEIGASSTDARVLHREESRNARNEIERAGFRFVSKGRFLRYSTDSSDWNAVATKAPTSLEAEERFLLTFLKP